MRGDLWIYDRVEIAEVCVLDLKASPGMVLQDGGHLIS